MNDPWDVKSVRRAGQYVSCMKMNGVPLLPPVLSKECRKEMQYYKLLAKEVEKRLSILQPYAIDLDSDSEDKTDAPELPEHEHISGSPPNELQKTTKTIKYGTPHGITRKSKYESPSSPTHITANIYNNTVTSNIVVGSNDLNITPSPKLVIDFNVNINDKSAAEVEAVDKKSFPPLELPERDYNCVKQYKPIFDDKNNEEKKVTDFQFSSDSVSNQFSDLLSNHDGPPSLSSKSFTGSLNDLRTDSLKKDSGSPKLIRQRSYTLLKPGPQLQAHLDIQSMNTGLDVNLISMSESVSNLTTPGKKRRSWDLESAKEKWSSMALELQQKQVKDGFHKVTTKQTNNVKSSPPRARSVAAPRRGSVTPKSLPKSEPLSKCKQQTSPNKITPNRPITNQPISPKEKEPSSPKHIISLTSESHDPATRVRELYEKIQKQQLIQMANLVEKQKREQLLLQQVFEEQNNLLFKQLKTICPKSPVEAKEAWVAKNQPVDRGPVSLSQLISHKSPDASISNSPVSSTLTDTNNCLSHCDDVLKKSRDIKESIKKSKNTSPSRTDTKSSSRPNLEGSRTRTHSPTHRNSLASRRLNYDTSASTDLENDPLLTDRTNDTLADLNVTFPSDSDEVLNTLITSNVNVMGHLRGTEMKAHGMSGFAGSGSHNYPNTDNAITRMQNTIQNSISCSISRAAKPGVNNPPTEKQRAAATKIVAHAKGFLVRRLMRTERVQGTVATIRDALLCALQLHQDRHGIRGADVDLHRRLIQQITAACYALHDTFVASTPAERCALLAADRARRRSLAAKHDARTSVHSDV